MLCAVMRVKALHMNLLPAIATCDPRRADTSAPQFEIHQECYSGFYVTTFRAQSVQAALDAFLEQRPAFEGGDVRVLDRYDNRILASVEWHMGNTDFGFAVYLRVNRFSDWIIEQLAHEVLARQKLIHSSATAR
jgi:hypothetical protein